MTPKPENVRTGLRVQEARIKAGFPTASKAAKALGMSASGYWRIETGINGLTIDRATELGRLFQRNPNYLLTGKDDSQSTGPEAIKPPLPLPRPAKTLIALLRGGMQKGFVAGDRTFLIPLDDRAMVIPGKIELGDYLAFDPDQEPKAGDVVAFKGSATGVYLIRRYMPAGASIKLVPFDSTFETHVYQKAKLPPIMGRFVALIRDAASAY